MRETTGFAPVSAATWVAGRILSVAAALMIAAAAPVHANVTGACHISPIVSDLERTARFYRDALGLELSSDPSRRPPLDDASRERAKLYGVPQARLRSVVARVPGMACGIEILEFTGVDRARVRPRLQDPGATVMMLLVRDIDQAFARLKAVGVPVVSTGGAPVTPATTSKTRAITLRDPDGQFVELVQLDPLPKTTAPATSNAFDMRFRYVVDDVDRTLKYYADHLGIPFTPVTFQRGAGVMAMMGLPPAAEYKVSLNTIPGSTLILEFLEIKGVDRRPVRPRIQDPGAYLLQLNVADLDERLAALTSGGSQTISPGGAPARVLLEQPWRAVVVRDPDSLFVMLREGPLR